MSALNSALTFIGPWPPSLTQSGFHVFTHWSQAQSHLQKNTVPVIGLNLTTLLEKNFQKFFAELWKLQPSIVLILVAPKEISIRDLAMLRRQFPIGFILNEYSDPLLIGYLHRALEVQRWKGHFHDLEKMRLNHAEQLQRLQSELKERIEKREKNLTDSRRKIVERNTWTEISGKVISAAVRAATLEELSTQVAEVLQPVFGFSSAAILPEPGAKKPNTHSEELVGPDNKGVGFLVLQWSENKKLAAKEKKFLQEIAESLALTASRLLHESRMLHLQDEWKQTFQAIEHPLALIDENFNILQSNRPGEEAKCYTRLFSRTEPCPGCTLGQTFTLQQDGKFISVRGQKISTPSQTEAFLHSYEDLTDKKQIEADIVASASLAEMGTVAGSIAHELNNPLAGIISFLQLIKTDLPAESPWTEDIREMEDAAQRSKKIIQDLLSFVRTKSL